MSTELGQLSHIRTTIWDGRRRHRSFLTHLPEGAEVLDVGCGNDTPYLTKSLRPDIRYVGLDVGDYNQAHDPKQYADEYLAVPADGFAAAIRERRNQFDAVVSSHNLEHCEDPDGVLVAMAQALRPGGRIYLAFPSAATKDMPSRDGTLNFWDDVTHIQPPDYRQVIEMLRAEGITVEFAVERYRTVVRTAVGLFVEPVSRLRGKVMPGTWALYGFESVIWGSRPA
jgi:SAM-dependent methyltransferase